MYQTKSGNDLDLLALPPNLGSRPNSTAVGSERGDVQRADHPRSVSTNSYRRAAFAAAFALDRRCLFIG